MQLDIFYGELKEEIVEQKQEYTITAFFSKYNSLKGAKGNIRFGPEMTESINIQINKMPWSGHQDVNDLQYK